MKQQVAFEYEGRSYTVEVERSGDTLVIESEASATRSRSVVPHARDPGRRQLRQRSKLQ